MEDDRNLLTLADDVIMEEEIIEKELRRSVLKAIEALGSPDRDIIFRKYYYGQTSKEIARDLGPSVSNVDTRAHRAILKLRKLFGGEEA
jgi:RNA polymerase sigma-70 factor (ECF subfamily)